MKRYTRQQQSFVKIVPLSQRQAAPTSPAQMVHEQKGLTESNIIVNYIAQLLIILVAEGLYFNNKSILLK
jgi:hypothetical protein